MMDFCNDHPAFDDTFIEKIHAEWGNHTAVLRQPRQAFESAVVLPLVKKADAWHLLFELRAFDLDVQPGEVCFPGGRIEPGENPQEAALREVAEELLVSCSQVEILAALDGISGPGGRTIWPFIGILKDYENTWSKDEVDHTFTIPLSWFFDHEPVSYNTTLVTVPADDFPIGLIPGGKDYPWHTRRHPVLFYLETKPLIWGITAMILKRTVDDLRANLIL